MVHNVIQCCLITASKLLSHWFQRGGDNSNLFVRYLLVFDILCFSLNLAELMSKTADFERLENLVDKTQQDKRKLGVRVSRLVQTGA